MMGNFIGWLCLISVMVAPSYLFIRYYTKVTITVAGVFLAVLAMLNDPAIILDAILALSFGVIVPGLALLTGVIAVSLVIGGVDTARLNRQRGTGRSRSAEHNRKKLKRKPKVKREWV